LSGKSRGFQVPEKGKTHHSHCIKFEVKKVKIKVKVKVKVKIEAKVKVKFTLEQATKAQRGVAV
jgi:hypothetical protein